MDTALETIKQCAATADEATRRKLVSSLNQLVLSMESPNDTVHRYGHMSLQTATIKVGLDLGLFEMLTKAEGPLAVDQIADTKDAEPQLIHRVMRYLAATGALAETSPSHFEANNVTKNLTQRVVVSGLGHYLDTVEGPYNALPAFLKKTGYTTPQDSQHTAFQDAWNTQLPSFRWLGEHPDHLASFNEYMATRRQPDASWLSVYPVPQEVKNWDAKDGTRALYVNIGGGVGHQCQQFKERYPSLPGRVILQDLPHSIENALPTPGVENLVHDFFQPQPIKDAKFYFLRGVLHDHPTSHVHKILGETKAAMGPESVLLIDEMILPESGVNTIAASIDMTMLTALAGVERTKAQWAATIRDVGLELVDTFMYNPLMYEGVMHVRLPSV